MSAGSKRFPAEDPTQGDVLAIVPPRPLEAAAQRAVTLWAEIFVVLALLEAILWTPRSIVHTLMVIAIAASVLWFTWRSGYSQKNLGFTWPTRQGTWFILATGGLIALAIPLGALATGHPVPANPDWPQAANLWPYIIWAFLQQFLLQSFFFLRFEAVLGSRRAVLASTILFTLAHLPNLALTSLTFFGALFFTEMFRRYRSIYPLGIVHALLGIAVAYTFTDSVMHHMRVGLGFLRFR